LVANAARGEEDYKALLDGVIIRHQTKQMVSNLSG